MKNRKGDSTKRDGSYLATKRDGSLTVTCPPFVNIEENT